MGIKDSQEHVGFIAQDLERAIPEAVSRNSQGYLLVNNDPILWTMLNSIKQQQAEIEALGRSVQERDAQIQRPTKEEQALLRHRPRRVNVAGRPARGNIKGKKNRAGVIVVTSLKQ